MVASACLIFAKWPENYGSRQFGLGRTFLEGVRAIFADKTILFLGIVQSAFESIMYIFVFLWTPILDSAGGNWPLGLVFSCFMVSIMIGSSANTLLLSRNIPPSTILLIAMTCSALSMCTCAFSTSINHQLPILSFLAFLLLEISVGLYFPCIGISLLSRFYYCAHIKLSFCFFTGFLRSQVIPESLRANIMNWFRVSFVCLIIE